MILLFYYQNNYLDILYFIFNIFQVSLYQNYYHSLFIQISQQQTDFPEIPADRYRIVQSIGRGAFSRCYLALSPEFKASCVKRIRMTAKPHTLLKEIEFLRKLSGKENIVQIKEVRFCEQNLQVSVITNYMDGDDFKATILDFTPLDIQKYMKSLLLALNEISQTCLHRDVKSGNFLMQRATGRGMLIDFGLAQSIKEAREFPLLRVSRKGLPNENETWQQKIQRWCNDFKAYGTGMAGPVQLNNMGLSNQSSTQLGGVQSQSQINTRPLPAQPHSGTHGYRAPEILLPVKNQSPKIDLWSAGVILLQLITGKTSIFRGSPNTDIYELLAIRSIIGADRFAQQCGLMGIDFTLTAGVPTPSNISYEELCQWYNPDLFAVLPKSCFDLLRGLLAFRPEKRFSAAQALQSEFMTAENLPDFRYQDGACRKLGLSNLNGVQGIGCQLDRQAGQVGSQQQLLKDRQALIGQQLGFTQATMQTLVTEYSKMLPQQMIALNRDIRKTAEQAIKTYKLTDSTVLGNGLIVQRPQASEYNYSTTQALQDLDSCTPVQIVRPAMARTRVDWESYWNNEKSIEMDSIEQSLTEIESKQEEQQTSNTELATQQLVQNIIQTTIIQHVNEEIQKLQNQLQSLNNNSNSELDNYQHISVQQNASIQTIVYDTTISIPVKLILIQIQNMNYFITKLQSLVKDNFTQQFFYKYQTAADIVLAVKFSLYKTFEKTQQNSLENFYEVANSYKEEFEKTVRQTAYRRRVDQWIQPLKALDKELQKQQQNVRQAAEEWRELVIQKGCLNQNSTSDSNLQTVKQQEINVVSQYVNQKMNENKNNSIEMSKTETTVDINQPTEPECADITNKAQVEPELQYLDKKVNQNVENEIKTEEQKENQPQVLQTRKQELLEQLAKLYNQSSQLTSLSHRVSLTGPSAWNAQSYKFYTNNSTSYTKEINFVEIQQKAYQLSRSISIYSLQLQQSEQLINYYNNKINELLDQQHTLGSQIEVSERSEKNQLKFKYQNIKQLIANKKQQLADEQAHHEELSKEYDNHKAEAASAIATYKENVNQFINDNQSADITNDNIQGQNMDNIAGDIEVTNELSNDIQQEIRPPDVPLYDPDELQELFYISGQQIQSLLQQSDQEIQQKQQKRTEIRNAENLRNKKLDQGIWDSINVVQQIIDVRQELVKEIDKERQDNIQEQNTEVIEEQNDKQITLPQLISNYQIYNQEVENMTFTQFCNKFNYNYKQILLNQNQQTIDHRRGVFDLLTSPQGRYYLCLHRIFSDNPNIQLPESPLIQLLQKQGIYLPKQLLSEYEQLKQLTTSYITSSVGQKDLILAAAAVQSELDYQSSLIDSESQLAALGLSKRPQNLAYILQLQQYLNPIIAQLPTNSNGGAQQQQPRSTSSITGLTKSATHRSLVDPARTLSRYPQTAKYIQTILDQTMRKYVSRGGVIEEIEKEIKMGIKAIQIRLWEISLQKLFEKAKGKQKIEIGRIMDLIDQYGAEVVYDISVGLDKVNFVSKENNNIMQGDNQEQNNDLEQPIDKNQVFIEQNDIEKIKNGNFDKEIQWKMQIQNERKRTQN